MRIRERPDPRFVVFEALTVKVSYREPKIIVIAHIG
jgi:hypothetical protein